jgi:hypothetical protein
VPVNRRKQGPCQTVMLLHKQLNWQYFLWTAGPGSDINQSAFGGNLGDFRHNVTFFVSHKLAALATADSVPSTGVVQECSFLSAGIWSTNFS